MEEHAEHILIHGHVFKWEEKAPFVPCGVSIQGAIEYRPKTDEMRCHECGEWFSNLGSHVRVHDVSVATYKLTHGLVVRTNLTSQATRIKYRANIERQGSRERRINNLKACVKTGNRQKRVDFETRNARNKCNAQMLFTIKRFILANGRNPVIRELKDIGLHSTDLSKAFNGAKLDDIYVMASGSGEEL